MLLHVNSLMVSLEQVIPHYCLRPFWVLDSMPQELWGCPVCWWEQKFSHHCVSTGYCFFWFFWMVLFSTLDSFLAHMGWSVLSWIFERDPVQNFRVLCVQFFPIQYSCILELCCLPGLSVPSLQLRDSVNPHLG